MAPTPGPPHSAWRSAASLRSQAVTGEVWPVARQVNSLETQGPGEARGDVAVGPGLARGAEQRRHGHGVAGRDQAAGEVGHRRGDAGDLAHDDDAGGRCRPGTRSWSPRRRWPSSGRSRRARRSSPDPTRARSGPPGDLGSGHADRRRATHNEIGTDPGAIKAYLQGVEDLGMTHLLIYDHVLGADPDRPGGFERSLRQADIAFHEPFTFFAFAAAVTDHDRTGDHGAGAAPAPDGAGGQAGGRGGPAVGRTGSASGSGPGGTPLNTRPSTRTSPTGVKRQDEQVRAASGAVGLSDNLTFEGQHHTVERASINRFRPTAPIPIWFGGSAPALLERCARLGDGFMPLGGANEKSAGPARPDQDPPGGGREDDGRLRRPGPGPVRWWNPRALAEPRLEVEGHRGDPPGHRHPQRRADRCRRSPGRIAEYRDATAEMF